MPDLFVNQQSDAASLSIPKNGSLATPVTQHMHFFAAMAENPLGVTYADQDKDETIVLFLRRHMITNLGWIITAIVLLLLPMMLIFLPGFSALIPTGMQYKSIGIALYIVAVLGFTLYQLTNWFYNISLVSDKKVVDINYHSLTAKDVSATTLDSVEDIKYQQPGIFKTQYNFGNVEILTQAQGSEIIFEDVPKPAQVVDIVLDLKRKITEP